MRAIPTARILQAARSRKWKVPFALAELLDNSFGELRGHATTVWIDWHPKTRILTVLDDGQGMDDVIDLFTPGKGSASGANDTGFYGSGGSEALLWLSSAVAVVTLSQRTGKAAHGFTNWDDCIGRNEFPEIDRRWRTATPATCSTELIEVGHGTFIRMVIRSGVNISPEGVQERLSRLFGAGLRAGRRIVWRTHTREGEVIETSLHPLDPGTMQHVINARVTLDNGLYADVTAGYIPDLPLAQSKLSVSYVYRQILETTEGFGRALQGAIGTLDLSPGWLPHLTTTKDDIQEESRALKDELMAKTAEALAPLIATLQDAKTDRIFANIKLNLRKAFPEGLLSPEPDEQLEPDEPTEDEPTTDERPARPGRPRVPTPARRTAELDIRRQTDAALGGLLCRVDVVPTGITAFVNNEHELVRTALEREPINMRLLETIIMFTLAMEIARLNKGAAFGLMPAKERAALDEQDDTPDVVPLLLTRRLIDRVVSPPVE